MAIGTPDWTIGIEEEYLMVERETGNLTQNALDDLMAACQKELGDYVHPEFLKSQIEVSTPVCQSVDEAGAHLRHYRQTIARLGEPYGLTPLAVSTHPHAEWDTQGHTDADRYHRFAHDMQGVVRRLVISGMHVHVGINDDHLRIDLMNQISYFLPHLLALSTSSPFWRGQDTGLKCYRLSVFDELPRTGLPEQFDGASDYDKHVEMLKQIGVIKDASMLWWDVRPAVRFPTLEMRITDVCTSLDDALAIAALYQCLLRMLYRLRRNNQRWRTYKSLLVNENRWRAQRYGTDNGLIDFGKAELVGFDALVAELIDMLREDAQALNCQENLDHLPTILSRGTSAHRQLAVYQDFYTRHNDHNLALKAVTDWLMTETLNVTE